MSRPCWSDYFLGLAFAASFRSPDPHTKHGCIITDSQNKILGVGYNGFLRGVPDERFPLNRPSGPDEISKYDYVFHAEQNALANCVLRPHGATAYVTGQSCVDCTKSLYQHGVSKIVMARRHGSRLITEKDIIVFQNIVSWSGLQIEYRDIDTAWLSSGLSHLQNSLSSSQTSAVAMPPPTFSAKLASLLTIFPRLASKHWAAFWTDVRETLE